MRFYIHTFGCRLNRAESERTAWVLRLAGWEELPQADGAEIIIVNSCGVTTKAERGSRQYFSVQRKRNPNVVLVAMGCAVTNLSEALYDLSIPAQDKDRAGELILAAYQGYVESRENLLPYGAGLSRAFLKIQDGCSGVCSYCVVAQRRGPPRHTPTDRVLDDARKLIDSGVGEIVITGCNLSLYPLFTNLIERLLSATSGARYRISSFEPTSDLVQLAALMASDSRLCPYLHIPLQSGDNEVLRQMRRRYRREELLEWLLGARNHVQNLSLGADCIVGFPGESESAFEATQSLLQIGDFAHLHVFPYSERPGTDAPNLPGRVPNVIRKERAQRLAEQVAIQRQNWLRRWNQSPAHVVVESFTPQGQACGWAEWYQQVTFPNHNYRRGELVTLYPVLIALGSNLGNREATIDRAVEHLSQRVGPILERAPNYENAPQGFSGPPFLNTVLRLRTTLPPLELLRITQQIEADLGRPANHTPLTSRSIDIDILDYNGMTLSTPTLTLPHPRAHLREFVQIPLSRLEPIPSEPTNLQPTDLPPPGRRLKRSFDLT